NFCWMACLETPRTEPICDHEKPSTRAASTKWPTRASAVVVISAPIETAISRRSSDVPLETSALMWLTRSGNVGSMRQFLLDARPGVKRQLTRTLDPCPLEGQVGGDEAGVLEGEAEVGRLGRHVHGLG